MDGGVNESVCVEYLEDRDASTWPVGTDEKWGPEAGNRPSTVSRALDQGREMQELDSPGSKTTLCAAGLGTTVRKISITEKSHLKYHLKCANM